MTKNNENKKVPKSGGKIQCEKLRLIRFHWYGGRCMWVEDGKQCNITKDLELAHAIDTELSVLKRSTRSSWERLNDVMTYPERFLLFCPDHHMKFDGRTSVIWIGDYYSKVAL